MVEKILCLFYDRFLVSFFLAQTSSNLTSSGKVSLYAELEAPPPSSRPSLSWPLVQKRRKRGPLGKISFPMFCHIVQLRRWLMIPTLKRIIMSDRKWFLVCVWHSTHHRSFFCSYLPTTPLLTAYIHCGKSGENVETIQENSDVDLQYELMTWTWIQNMDWMIQSDSKLCALIYFQNFSK